MLQAVGLGFLAQTSLILCGLVVFWISVPSGIVGGLGGVGAGLLLGAVAFDLVPSAEQLSDLEIALWMVVGAAVFLLSDRWVDKRFGEQGPSAALGIVIGSVIDGVPESLIFGIQIAMGISISTAFLVAVFVSNVPQALAPSADLVKAGWGKGKLVGLWTLVAVACGVAAAVGWGAATATSDANGARAAALAMGGVLTMLTDSLMPFSFDRAKAWAGVWTAIGFVAALAMG
jgi:ZIP family zinc transporter